MGRLGTWCMRIVILLLVLGIPFFAWGGVGKLKGDADAVSAATAEAFDPGSMSGEYQVLINEKAWTGSDDLADWATFFRGEETPLLMDDIRCLAAAEDIPALEYADACIARLPANQMQMTVDTGLLTMSKAQAGRFQILILSRELADRYDAASIAAMPGIRTVEVTFDADAAEAAGSGGGETGDDAVPSDDADTKEVPAAAQETKEDAQ